MSTEAYPFPSDGGLPPPSYGTTEPPSAYYPPPHDRAVAEAFENYKEAKEQADYALLFSCLVTWCCNFVFGLIAFGFACKFYSDIYFWVLLQYKYRLEKNRDFQD